MIKIIISLVLLLLIYSCKNNSKSNIQSANSNFQDTSNNFYIKDSLDMDTSDTTISLYKDDTVNLFFRNADDTLWSYVMRSYILSNKVESFSLDSFKSIVNRAGFEITPCDKNLCGFKREFNKRYNFELRHDKEITLITHFEYWFEGEKYVSPFLRHDH